MRELIITNQDKETRISSVELVEIINQFRQVESETIGKEYKKLQHKNLMAKIKNEVEVLESLGLEGQLNFKPSSYTNLQNKEQPCYSLNRNGMLQMLNSESTLVRFKTIEYIENLENKLNNQKQLPTTFKEALLMLVEAEEEKRKTVVGK